MSYNSAETRVFWDVEDFPVPDGGDLLSFIDNIVQALENTYYHGRVSIMAYSAIKTVAEVRKLWCADVAMAYQTDNKHGRFNRMLFDMVNWAYMHNPSEDDEGHQVILIVIAKDIPEKGSALYSVLKHLDGMHYSIFLVLPDDGPFTTVTCTPEELLALPVFIWRWGSFFAGGPPVESYDPADFEFTTPKRPLVDTDSQGSSRGLKHQKNC